MFKFRMFFLIRRFTEECVQIQLNVRKTKNIVYKWRVDFERIWTLSWMMDLKLLATEMEKYERT